MLKLIQIFTIASVLLCGCAVTEQMPTQGTLEKIQVFGSSLEGNLAGDDPMRDVFVYLPPSYTVKKSKRYPVIYFLHGYAVGAEVYVDEVLQMPGSVDAAMAAGAEEVIIVIPDAFTRYGGSMYSSSATNGDWEGFISRELVSYIDDHYRTLASPGSRGLSGHSMGGYGTLRIGMKHPGIFGSLYAMSSCCLLNEAPGKEAVLEEHARMTENPRAQQKSLDYRLQAQAAAWAPNPKSPPYYFDWPYRDGEVQPLVQGKWIANSPLILVDQFVPALKQYKAIMLDVGDKDRLVDTNTQFDAALTRLGLEHGWEVYDGTHGNRVGSRFVKILLPFFAEHLEFE